MWSIHQHHGGCLCKLHSWSRKSKAKKTTRIYAKTLQVLRARSKTNGGKENQVTIQVENIDMLLTTNMKTRSMRLSNNPKIVSELSSNAVLGGQDTCQGDSGGPLWTVVDGRAVLIGRGNDRQGCALALTWITQLQTVHCDLVWKFLLLLSASRLTGNWIIHPMCNSFSALRGLKVVQHWQDK